MLLIFVQGFFFDNFVFVLFYLFSLELFQNIFLFLKQKKKNRIKSNFFRYYRAPELIFGATDYTTKIGNIY